MVYQVKRFHRHQYCILTAKEATLYGCRAWNPPYSTIQFNCQDFVVALWFWRWSLTRVGPREVSNWSGRSSYFKDILFTYNLSDEDDVNCGNVNEDMIVKVVL